MRKYHNAEAVRTPYQVAVNEKLLNWRIEPHEAVVVIGGYDGETCDFILERYPEVELFTFEPQPAMYQALAARYYDERNVHVFPFALGDRDGEFPMVRIGTMFASFLTGPLAQIQPEKPNGTGEMREWSAVMAELGVTELAWFHSNIEGYEYQLLPHLIRSGWIGKIGQLVVATHGAPVHHPNAWLWEDICAALGATHLPMWREMGWFAFGRPDRVGGLSDADRLPDQAAAVPAAGSPSILPDLSRYHR